MKNEMNGLKRELHGIATETIKYRAVEMLETAINEIFAAAQTELDIESGDIAPDRAFAMDMARDALAEQIATAILEQIR